MEQKQLDDLEDSFFGEEFIEDLEDLPPISSKSQEIKIEPREEPTELRLRKSAKKAISPAFKKGAVKKIEKITAVKTGKETFSEEKPIAAEKIAEVKEHKEKRTFETPTKKETVTINIKPAKEAVKTPRSETFGTQEGSSPSTQKGKPLIAQKASPFSETKPTVETSSPINPWEDEHKSSSLFKETSTWKALTGLMLVLLVLSLFTQGFNFSEKTAVTGAATTTMTLQEAEQKVLTYVNTQLLQAPFQAEVQSSEELSTLYKVTLTVAGQTVDSYATKDGKLFFPQGLNLDETVLGNKDSKLSENQVHEETNDAVETEKSAPNEPELVSEIPVESQKVEDSAAVGDTVKLTLNAKKWIFQPNVLRVKKGSKVVLTVVPNGLDFTFAVPTLGIEKKVVGTTEVAFTADKDGTFDYVCGSCEDWRGMRGNLVVEYK